MKKKQHKDRYIFKYIFTFLCTGAVCVLRPLLCIWSAGEIRKALGICFILLNTALGILLWKRKQKELFFLYFFSLLFIKIWVTVFSIEYIMAFILMTVMIICFVVHKKTEEWQIFQFSIISGVLTCFFDFLTVETVTITVPLLFLFVIKQNTGRLDKWKKELGFMITSCLFWGFSYGGMFFIKWLLAAKLMGSRVFREVLDTAGYRIAHGENGTFQRLLVCLGMVPYLRYLALSGHSTEHYFFTYRAQLATIMAVGMIAVYKGKMVLKERKDI